MAIITKFDIDVYPAFLTLLRFMARVLAVWLFPTVKVRSKCNTIV